MGVVTRKMLHRHMSEPHWTTAQEAEADRLVIGVERELEGHLYGAHITPIQVSEMVPVARGGMLATTYPVASVLAIDGVAAVEDDEGMVPPTGYTLREHRLWRDAGQEFVVGVPWPTIDPYAPAPRYSGSIAVTYLGGWGSEPALVEVILRKAAHRMSGRHADTIVVSGLTSMPPGAGRRSMGPTESPNFTEDDMKALGQYRALGWGGVPQQ